MLFSVICDSGTEAGPVYITNMYIMWLRT